ncbi:MAG: TlpA family protein disulfide reductase [Nocardioidaceae bacterium]
MRRALLTVLTVLLLAGCQTEQAPSQASAPAASNVDVDTPALRTLKQRIGVEQCEPGASRGELPHVTLNCLGGGPDVNLSRLRGPLVINLFAQWCGPCRAEMPYYQQLHRKARGEVRVLGIDYLDTQPARALDLVRRTGVTYPLLADPSGVLRPDFKIRGLPGVVLVDAKGKVADVEFRVVRSYAELRNLVQRELDVRVPR